MDGWGVSDPGAIAWGEVGRRKPRVAHAPMPCTDTSPHWQRAAKNAARSVSTITARLCITSSSLAASRDENRNPGGSPILQAGVGGGPLVPRASSPGFANFCERPAGQAQRDARRHEAAPGTRSSHAHGPRCREPRVMPPGRRHGFLLRSSADGLRRIGGYETLFELPARGLDLRPTRPTPMAEAVAETGLESPLRDG